MPTLEQTQKFYILQRKGQKNYFSCDAMNYKTTDILKADRYSTEIQAKNNCIQEFEVKTVLLDVKVF